MQGPPQRPFLSIHMSVFVLITFLSPFALPLEIPDEVISETKINLFDKSDSHNDHSGILPYHELPIYGNASIGYYYVKIYLGTPDPQPQSVIIDTGSGLLAVPGSDCKKCSRKHIDPPYDPDKSKSSEHLNCASKHPACTKNCHNQLESEQCTFSIFYAEGSSLQGYIVEDDIRFETYSIDEQIRSNFGYTNKQTNLFLSQKANGIFGLAPKRQSDILERMVQKHSPKSGEKLSFSLCLSVNGGIMTIGGINDKLHKNQRQPTIIIPYSDRQNLYSLNGVKQISIEEELLHIPGNKFGYYGIFVDSGSTFSYLPRQNFNTLQTKLNRTCLDSGICKTGKGEDSTCYQLDLKEGETLDAAVSSLFPPIEFYILDQRIYWKSTKYLLIRQESQNQVCLGILGLDRYLLGANWMYNRDIVFDLENKNLIIYDDVNCQEQEQSMGRCMDEQQISKQIDFTAHRQIRINTESTTFAIGVISLIIAFMILILLNCTSLGQIKRKRKYNVASSEAEGQIFTNQTSQ